MSSSKHNKRNRLAYSLLFSSALLVYSTAEVANAETIDEGEIVSQSEEVLGTNNRPQDETGKEIVESSNTEATEEEGTPVDDLNVDLKAQPDADANRVEETEPTHKVNETPDSTQESEPVSEPANDTYGESASRETSAEEPSTNESVATEPNDSVPESSETEDSTSAKEDSSSQDEVVTPQTENELEVEEAETSTQVTPVAVEQRVASAQVSSEEVTPPEIMVTEILPNTNSTDEFEYFEVTNTTDSAINLNNNGYTFSYGYTDDADTTDDIALSFEDDVTIGGNGSVVFWLSYQADNLDSYAYSEQDFRDTYGMTSDANIYRITGQNGMANGGNRSIRVFKNGELDNWSFYSEGPGVHNAAHFAVPITEDSKSMRVLESSAAPTPGMVTEAQFTQPAPVEPEPEVEIEAPTTSAPLIITEVVADTDNVSGSDAYEFIEIANVSDQTIDFGEFKINYLYPDTASEALWPSEPADVAIASGDTLVFWIKNGNNNDLTVDDFNAKFNTNLVLGQNIVEIYSGGMSNSGARGIQIQTNTGIPINRVFYNMNGKEVVYEQPFQYMPDENNLLEQIKLGTSNPTPGALEDYQSPQSPVTLPENAEEPVIEDLTKDTFTSQEALEITFNVRDDMASTTVLLTLQTSGDAEPNNYNLMLNENGQFVYRIEAIDLLAKDWIDYSLTVSDGQNITQTDIRRLVSTEADDSPVRINVTDDEWINGLYPIIGASDSVDNPVDIYVNGQQVAVQPSLESNPIFVMEVTATDDYFQNGVRVEGDLLHVFDEGTYSELVTMPVEVSQGYIRDDNQLVVSVYAGTKGFAGLDPDENNDDFDIIGMRLILPDGRTLYPVNYSDPSANMRMGDSAGKNDFFDFIFDIPADAFTASVNFLDTTQLEDGQYEITAVSASGDQVTTTINVDNTGPTVVPTINDDSLQKGEIVLDAEFTDSGIGFEGADFALNGEEIVSRYITSSTQLEDGQHQYVVRAYDALGNETIQIIDFIVPVENPTSSNHTPENGATVENDSITLEVDVEDATNDVLDVVFKEGYEVAPGSQNLKFGTGTVNDALTTDREDATALTESELAALEALDEKNVATNSVEELPYHIFEVNLPDTTIPGSKVRVNWDGHANGRAQIKLYALDENTTEWVEIDRHLTQPLEALETEYFTLEGLVAVDEFSSDGTITFLVQHSLGYAGPNHTTRESDVVPNHPGDEPRDSYDFTIGWETDTQYYNEEFYEHQVSIHDFFLEQRENMNLQYVFHTGDIVDVYNEMYQWENADAQYDRLDEAGLPYGVLAGNHDVGNFENDFSNYSDYFGEDRYADNPWYGGSYQDNRGHYDLISAGGIDFLMLYMGWEPGQEELDWMNDVLAAHPERVAVINVHEFLQTTGGLGTIPQAIMDQVVAPNPNVKMVLSGHYHDAYTRTDEFDDNGDGEADRTVTSMLFDYQGLLEGGQGYIRLLHFDNEGQQMKIRTYSESLQDYNSDDPSLLGPEGNELIFQEFNIPYSQLGIVPQERTLGTDTVSFEILTNNVLGSVEGVNTPDTVSITINDQEVGELGWYVQATDEFGGEYFSPVQYVNVVDEVQDTPNPEEPGQDEDRFAVIEEKLQDLEDKVQALETENAALASEIERLQSDLENLQNQLAASQKEITELENRIAHLEEEVGDVGQANDDSKSDIETGDMTPTEDTASGKPTNLPKEENAPQEQSSEEPVHEAEELPQTGSSSLLGSLGLGIASLLSGLGLTFRKKKHK